MMIYDDQPKCGTCHGTGAGKHEDCRACGGTGVDCTPRSSDDLDIMDFYDYEDEYRDDDQYAGY